MHALLLLLLGKEEKRLTEAAVRCAHDDGVSSIPAFPSREAACICSPLADTIQKSFLASSECSASFGVEGGQDLQLHLFTRSLKGQQQEENFHPRSYQ
jgi:hypothetical protein